MFHGKVTLSCLFFDFSIFRIGLQLTALKDKLETDQSCCPEQRKTDQSVPMLVSVTIYNILTFYADFLLRYLLFYSYPGKTRQAALCGKEKEI